jgi:hypothetical protein
MRRRSLELRCDRRIGGLMESLDEFTLIGDDDEDTKFDFEEAVPGVVRVMHQSLTREGDESWSRGEGVGFAHISVIIGKVQTAICHAVFVLGDDTIVAHGVLPVAAGTGIGDGVLAITGGTGAFDSVMGRIDVEVMNPKKYHIVTNTPG